MPGGGHHVNLVAGGAGFLGFHLCTRLLEEGQRVICLDDLSSGQPDHVEALRRYPKFEFIHGDVREKVDLAVDRIYNLASPASPVYYIIDPVKTLLTNVLGTQNMLELARVNGARMVQASTSEVYGDPLMHPQAESYLGNVNFTGPRACYDEGKRCAETLVGDYRRLCKVDCRVARIFNTYGPEMRPDDGRVVSAFITEALENRNITIQGDGSHSRSMCYVDDLIDGLVRLMNRECALDEAINLGNPEEIRVLDLAYLILEAVGSRSNILHLPGAVDDPHVRCPDISRAKAELGWEPHIRLKEGLGMTIEYFRKKVCEGAALQYASNIL